ncbi:MAG: hypothetical protein EZS28_014851, partial [Streblomastix strix]
MKRSTSPIHVSYPDLIVKSRGLNVSYRQNPIMQKRILSPQRNKNQIYNQQVEYQFPQDRRSIQFPQKIAVSQSSPTNASFSMNKNSSFSSVNKVQSYKIKKGSFYLKKQPQSGISASNWTSNFASDVSPVPRIPIYAKPLPAANTSFSYEKPSSEVNIMPTPAQISILRNGELHSPTHIFTRVEYDDDDNFFRSRNRRILSPSFASNG